MSTREHDVESIRSKFYQALMIGPCGAVATDDHIPLSPPCLSSVCEALGWQGGTVHQAVARIKELRRIENYLADRNRELKECNSTLAMYANAWQRELGGRLFDKGHRIDALVLTTAWTKERADQFKRVASALGIKHEHYDRTDNAKLGTDVMGAVHALANEVKTLRIRCGIPADDAPVSGASA